MLLIGATACGAEFTRDTGGVDAADPVEAGADRAAGDGAPDADPPAVAEGLLLWLRADLGVTESSGAISEWSDQSGNQLHARQVEAARQPTLATTGVGGRPAILFNAEDFLSLPSGFNDFTRGVSIFVVALVSDTTVMCADFVHLSNGPEIDDIAVGRHSGRAQYEVLQGVLGGSDFSLGRPHIVSVIHDPDESISMRFDGGQRAQGTFALPAAVTRLTNVIGRSLYADCGSVHGALAEVLVYQRALTDAERLRVETQLQNRWSCCR